MKRILLIALCLISLAITMMADEKEDSLVYYAQHYDVARQSGDYHEACIYLGAILHIYKSINENISRDAAYALLLFEYVDCCCQIGEYELAIKKGTEASEIYKEVLGTNNFQYFQFINILAMCNSKLGKREEADRLVSQALEIREELSEWDAHELNRLAQINYNRGDYLKAIELYSHASEILKKKLGEKHLDYAALLNDLACCYSCMKDYSKAIELLLQALEIRKEEQGEEHPDYATPLNNLVHCYLDLDDYPKAIELCLHASEILKKRLGEELDEEYLDYAALLHRIAGYYDHIGKYDKAVELGLQALEIRKKILGEENLDYAASLNNLAVYYSMLDDYDKAIELGSQALEIEKKILGEENLDYAGSLYNLAGSYGKSGDYVKAIELGSQALEIRKRLLGEEHLDCAASLNDLAACYYNLDDKVKAIELGSQALEIRKKKQGEEHPDYASSLNNLASYYYQRYAETKRSGEHNEAVINLRELLRIYKSLKEDINQDTIYALLMMESAWNYYLLGDYDKAIEISTELSELHKATSRTENYTYARAISIIAKCKSKLGKYQEAISLASEALEIEKRLLSEENPDYAASLCDLALDYNILGNHAIAFKLASHATEILERSLDEEDPIYTTSLARLASCYYYLGDYDKAIEIGLHASDILKRLDENSSDYAASLNDLMLFCSRKGDHVKAIELGLQALEIRKKRSSEKPLDYAASLDNLALCYYRFGDYDKAVELGLQALKIEKKRSSEKPLDYASSLDNLAAYYSALYDYPKAIELGLQALDIRKKQLGEEHLDYAASLVGIALSHYWYGDTTLLVPSFEEYISIVRNNVLNNFSELTAIERHLYWNKYRFVLNLLVPQIIRSSERPNTSSFLYDNIALFSKGLLLSTELEMAKLIQESGDEEAEQMYSELRQNRQILNFQYSKPIAERSINCDSLERVSTDLERKLSSRVQEFGDFKKNLSITWNDVQSKLDDSDLAIEILTCQGDSTTIYIALTLCKNDTAPLLTPLFTESQLKEVAGKDNTYQNAAADSLIWGDLAYRLEGKSRVYFSAAGMLHGIGIEYLPSMEGKECYRLSSTRELVTHKPSEGIKSATLFGGIDYDATYASIKTPATSAPSDLSAPSPVLYAENTASGPIIYKQGGRGGLDEYNSMRTMRYSVRPLPGSRKEIQDISSLLKESSFNVQDCDTITRNQASEESFKALSGQRRSLIHISTHGFYYDTIAAKNKGKHLRLMLMGDDRPSRSEDKSLLRCGLCFAGANQFLREMKNPADGQDEGILNALEIAQTDLRGLDLVVLSACQTALGDVVNGEGVFGLQRGFKKAGAQSILMSLWKVDDDITALLMTEFYKAWTSGMTKAGALKAAQDAVKKMYPNPHDWAGFILLDALD